MKRQNLLQAITLAEMLQTGNSYTKTDTYINLLKLARKLSNIDVHSCNGTKYTEDNAYTVATEKIYQKIKEVLSDSKLYFYHQSDPRGASLYISAETITSTNYNNGLAIY